MDIQQSSEEILLLKPWQFLHLFEYPHPLVKRSKVINLQLLLNSESSQNYFHQRVELFIELSALFLISQSTEQPLYVSKHIYLSHNNLIFMTYTYVSKYASIMFPLALGNIAHQIRQIYSHVFCWNSQFKKLSDDFQKRNLLVKTHQFLQMEIEGSGEQDYRQIAQQLENTQLLQQYFLPKKISGAVLIHHLLKAEEIMKKYVEFEKNHVQLNNVLNLEPRQIIQTVNQQTRDIRDVFIQFSSVDYVIFKSMEDGVNKENKTSKEGGNDKKNQKISICYKFETNFNQAEGGITSRQQNSESSLDHLSEERPNQEFDRTKRENEHIQNISKYKNHIDFTIHVDYQVFKQKIQDQLCYRLRFEGLTKWPIGEYYYAHVKGIWDKFVNIWNEQTYEQGQYLYELRHYPLEVEIFFKKAAEETVSSSKDEKSNNGRVGLRQQFSSDLKYSTLQKIIFTVDKFYILFLLFQKLLSTVYKISENIACIDEDLYEGMSESGYIDKMVKQFKQATSQYRHWAQEFQGLRSEKIREQMKRR